MDFHCFFFDLLGRIQKKPKKCLDFAGVAGQKPLYSLGLFGVGNEIHEFPRKILILLVSPVEIIVFPEFPRFFSGFHYNTQKTLENIMILTSDTSNIQTFPRLFLILPKKIRKRQWTSEKSEKNLANPKIL